MRVESRKLAPHLIEPFPVSKVINPAAMRLELPAEGLEGSTPPFMSALVLASRHPPIHQWRSGMQGIQWTGSAIGLMNGHGCQRGTSTRNILMTLGHTSCCRAQLLVRSLRSQYCYTVCVIADVDPSAHTSAAGSVIHSVRLHHDGLWCFQSSNRGKLRKTKRELHAYADDT